MRVARWISQSVLRVILISSHGFCSFMDSRGDILLWAYCAGFAADNKTLGTWNPVWGSQMITNNSEPFIDYYNQN